MNTLSVFNVFDGPIIACMQLVIITILFLPGPDGYGHQTGILCFPPNIPPDAAYCFCNNSAYPRYGKDFITGCAHTSHKTVTLVPI